jgi:predicted PurR-regulated permease PerM
LHGKAPEVRKSESHEKAVTRSQIFLTALTIITIALLSLVVFPLFAAILFAAILAGVLWPLRVWMARRLRGRPNLASAIIVLLTIVTIFGPIIGFSALFITELLNGVQFSLDTFRNHGATGLLAYLPKSTYDFGRTILQQIPSQTVGELTRNLRNQLSAQGGNAAVLLATTFSAATNVAFNILMMLIALYALLLQGDQLLNWFERVLPLRVGQFREIVVEFKKVAFAVLVSSLITSAVQTLAALLGFLAFRVPHPLFFTGTTFFFAFIPVFGAASVSFVAAFLLLFTGHPYAATCLSIWAFVVVGTVDNLIKPILLKSDLHMNGAVVFFSLIGGITAFGAIGILLGPLIVSLFLVIMKMHKIDPVN